MVVAARWRGVGALMHLCIHISALSVLGTNRKTARARTTRTTQATSPDPRAILRKHRESKRGSGEEVGVKLLRNNNTRRRSRQEKI
jgi:hypothetical protein